MPTRSNEDTMIEARPKRSASLFADSADDADAQNSGSVFERCRTVFRQIGERVTSFELSRQIYD
jgi:hypothetical protein